MTSAGAAYDAESKDMKKRADEGEAIDFKARGPPYLRVWLAMLKAGAKEYPAVQKDIEAYWRDVVLAGDALSLGTHVRYCRLRVNKKKIEGKELQAHVIIAIDSDTGPGKVMVEVVDKLMMAMNGKRTVGPPPRGPLERDAARLLALLS